MPVGLGLLGLLAPLAVFAGAACSHESGDTGAEPRDVIGFEVRDLDIPGALHAQGLTVPARLFVPTLADGAAPLPALLVLHGSGGLFAMPGEHDAATDERPCSRELEPQFTRWGERLASLGYVVLMPASYDARGFCDYHKDRARIPDDFDDSGERLVGRLYDADAASRLLCDLPEVDCERLGMLGFSHGASTVMLALHWQVQRALASFGRDEGLTLELPVVPLLPDSPAFQVGVAYYPGCGLESVVGFSRDPGDAPADMYFPSADLFIEHGSEDDLVEDCSADFGEGRRQLQSAAVARADGLDDPFHVRVHAGARHGFDNAGADGDDEGSDSTRREDLRARDLALDATLERLADRLGGARRLP